MRTVPTGSGRKAYVFAEVSTPAKVLQFDAFALGKLPCVGGEIAQAVFLPRLRYRDLPIEECLDGVGGGFAYDAPLRDRIVSRQEARLLRRLTEQLGAGALAHLGIVERLAGRMQRYAADRGRRRGCWTHV